MSHKLLVIDDDLGVLNMVGDYFRFCGFHVFTAQDGLDGIKICKTVFPDAILLDHKLRRMDGSKAVPYLRRIVPDAKIFVVSAYRDEIYEKRYTGLDVDAFFEKPVAIFELQAAIQHALWNRSETRAFSPSA